MRNIFVFICVKCLKNASLTVLPPRGLSVLEQTGSVGIMRMEVFYFKW